MSPYTFSTQVLFRGEQVQWVPVLQRLGKREENWKVGRKATSALRCEGREEALGRSRTELRSAGWGGFGGKVSVWGPG